MRHRKIANTKAKGVRPLAHSVLDLMIEFILTHINRNLQYDLFQLCLGIIHRLLCFQKRCRIRIDFNWKELWSALITLLKFFLNNESYLFKQQFNIFVLSIQVVGIFNLFILYGDSFLASDLLYDELYYEIIRMHTVFDNLNSLGKPNSQQSHLASWGLLTNFFFIKFSSILINAVMQIWPLDRNNVFNE